MILLCPPEKNVRISTTLSILRKYAQKALCTKTPLTGGVTGKTFTDTEKNKTEKFYPFSNWDCRIRQPSNEQLSAQMDRSSLSKLSSFLGEASELLKKILDGETASSQTSRSESSGSSGNRV